MNVLKVLFCNIEEFYKINKDVLIKKDGVRPSKSIPRDIFEAINKFKSYYVSNFITVLTKDQISSEILNVATTTDTFATNLRLMREFEFLIVNDQECIFTEKFVEFVKSNMSIEEYFTKQIEKIKDMDSMNMLYNSVLCVLREGYLYSEIYGYPDGKPEFEQIITDKEERIKYCKRVNELYGFVGRGGSIEEGNYTPNANYRVLTPLVHLNWIEKIDDNRPLKVYKLTQKGLLILKKIDSNLERYIRLNKHTITPVEPRLSKNRIVFGAPGTGKSYKLEEERNSYFIDNFERVTFHPNYSYSQFVGTYKPVPCKDSEGKDTITYDFVAGPFLRVLVEAMRSNKRNQEESHLLLIEEINRANVAAVFGDVFQLLDRKNGSSEYEIETSEDMRKYLQKELGGDASDYKKIGIPSNMYIWATMNSADQGVFPIDTAFKRRWDFEYIGIDDNKEKMKDVLIQLGQDSHYVCWNELREKINSILSKECRLNEDKLLGPYFISKSIIEADEVSHIIKDNDKFLKAFESKVIMYLYDDAAKQKRSTIFAGCTDTSTYSKVCAEFRKKGEAIFEKDLTLQVSVQVGGEQVD